MSIQQNGQRVQGVGRVIGQPKTVGSRRPVALGAEVVSLLRKHQSSTTPHGYRWGLCGRTTA